MYFNRIYSFLLLFFIAIFAMNLTACTTKVVTKTVVKTEMVYQSVDPVLTARVQVSPPMAKQAYLSMAVYERESYLADYGVQLMQSLHNCNAQLSAISSVTEKWKETSNASKQAD